MKNLEFTKIEAAGNDFILVDNCQEIIAPQYYAALARELCPRRKGIGADGLIFIQAHRRYDFEMLYFNADGSGPVMCGNGARAAVLFVYLKGICSHGTLQFLAPDGPHQALYQPDKIGLNIHFDSCIKEHQADGPPVYFLDTGAPHVVLFQPRPDQLDIQAKAPPLRKKFNANVNYLSRDEKGRWHIRTYERGVEDETLACGTGATAAAMVLHQKKGMPFPVILHAPGGRLQVDQCQKQYWLWGPARKVFEGRRLLTKFSKR